MVSKHSYVIITHMSDPGRRVPAGRHRLDAPGTSPRYPANRRRPVFRRARHRRVERPAGFAFRYASVLVLLGALLVSGWFASAGATAFAQMIEP